MDKLHEFYFDNITIVFLCFYIQIFIFYLNKNFQLIIKINNFNNLDFNDGYELTLINLVKNKIDPLELLFQNKWFNN